MSYTTYIAYKRKLQQEVILVHEGGYILYDLELYKFSKIVPNIQWGATINKTLKQEIERTFPSAAIITIAPPKDEYRVTLKKKNISKIVKASDEKQALFIFWATAEKTKGTAVANVEHIDYSSKTTKKRELKTPLE